MRQFVPRPAAPPTSLVEDAVKAYQELRYVSIFSIPLQRRNIRADSGVSLNMRKRCRLAFPFIGIILFSIVSYHSLRVDRETPSRYFWWSSIRLDSDPSNRRNSGAIQIPCQEGKENCWELRTEWVDPGLLEQFLMLSALPAFVLGGFAVRSLGRMGINQVSSFMFLMPVLICAWYYLIGWLLDRWISKRSHLSTATVGKK